MRKPKSRRTRSYFRVTKVTNPSSTVYATRRDIAERAACLALACKDPRIYDDSSSNPGPWHRCEQRGVLGDRCRPAAAAAVPGRRSVNAPRAKASQSEEHTSELQSHSFISYAVFCL